MVEYFYYFDYLRGTNSLPVSPVYLIEHAKVFAIAVKYQIDGLRDLAASKFEDAATAHWKHDDFAHAVHVAFNSTAEEVTQLREVVSDILHQHFDVLKDKPEVETVVCNIPRLAYALLKRSRAGGKIESLETGEQSQFTESTCDDCGSYLVGGPRKNMAWYCPDCW